MQTLPVIVPVIQDRLTVSAENYLRLNEAIEAAFRFGSGKIKSCTKVPAIPSPQAGIARTAILPSGRRRRDFFSFNNPLGACPDCRGFGRTIGIDWAA